MSKSEVEIAKVVETFYFQRLSEGKVIPCSIECLADGSVYVNSEEFEILYEFAENAIERAIARVQSVGYEPVASKQ